MLIGEPTKYGAGIVLYGDYWDLKNLYATIHHISKNSPIKGGLNDFLIGLAYDIRHAYQKDREQKAFGNDDFDKVIYLGENILWPTFLFQLALLRWSAGFQPTNKEQQANLYRLEHCAEEALYEYDPITAKHCLNWLSSFYGESNDYLALYVEEVNYRYVCTGKAGKQRFKKLPESLYSLSTLSPHYTEFKAQIDIITKEKKCRPDDLHDMREGPEFKW